MTIIKSYINLDDAMLFAENWLEGSRHLGEEYLKVEITYTNKQWRVGVCNEPQMELPLGETE